jgi:hypothetical protein
MRANDQQADRGNIAAHATLLTLGTVLQFIEPRRRIELLDSLATTYDQAEPEAT